MIIWVKPSGVEVETNEALETVKEAESLGWKRKRKTKKKESK